MDDDQVKPPEYGSQEVVDRVAKFTRPRLPPPVDVFTGKKTCHVFKAPGSALLPSKLNPEQGQFVGHMSYVKCIGKECALWNAELLECLDVTKKNADARVPELLEQIDGFLRIHRTEGE